MSVRLNKLSTWWMQETGQRTYRQLQIVMRDLLSDCFGYYLLQLGNSAPPIDYRSLSSIKHQFILDSHRDDGRAVQLIYARPGMLPVMTDSVDCVVLIQTLDFADDPHQVLREVERVLIPEGVVIIIGFNPWHMLGMQRLFGRIVGDYPVSAHHIGLHRLQDWLTLLGFDLAELSVFGASEGSCRKLNLPGLPASVIGMAYPALGPLYAVKAIKRVSRLTPIEPAWKLRKSRIGIGAAEPTARVTTGRGQRA